MLVTKNHKNIIINTYSFSYIDKFEQQDKITQKIYINQSGYDINKPKVATITNVKSDTLVEIRSAINNIVVFITKVSKQKINFTNFNQEGEYYILCNNIRSHNFKIENGLLLRVSRPLAVEFMSMSRQDAFDVGKSTGYGWRDSHQFSFELEALVRQYLSNTTYYNSLPYSIYKVNECEYPELRIQNEPDLVWLIKFGVTRYYDMCINKGVKLHGLIKCQLAYFLYAYPQLSEYVTRDFYELIRDFTIQQWTIETTTLAWFDVAMNHNLLLTQNVVGTIKGALPPGFAIIPNLLMYEVCKRDGLEYQKYFDSAYNNCSWCISGINLDEPQYFKGQRMSERILHLGLAYFQKYYHSLAPLGLLDRINKNIDLIIQRSNNLWDFKRYDDTLWVGSGTMNECGNVAGTPSVCYAYAELISDTNKKKRLEEIAIAHFDNIFGRNPSGMHFCNKATSEFEGSDVNWYTRYQGGAGNLQYCRGMLDGSPKEASYPYEPNADLGYTEGWIAFNTAWMDSIAYMENYYK